MRLKKVRLDKIHAPPHFMAKVFAEREEDGEDLLLNAVEGPFSQPYFIGIICAHRNAEAKEKNVKAAKVKPEKLKEERIEQNKTKVPAYRLPGCWPTCRSACLPACCAPAAGGMQ